MFHYYHETKYSNLVKSQAFNNFSYISRVTVQLDLFQVSEEIGKKYTQNVAKSFSFMVVPLKMVRLYVDFL